MKRTRVKICGITRSADALAAVEAGADAIGLVFYPDSPRNVTIRQAAEIARQVPAFVTTVALFVDAAETTVRDVLASVPVDLLQFHGKEHVSYCESFSRPYIKAIRMHAEIELATVSQQYPTAKALLLDTWVAGQAGGTGQAFDWSRVTQGLPQPIILAGGLDAENVEQAIQIADPWAVDVSGGVEAAKGIKDPQKISAFIRGVERANAGKK